MCLLPIEYADGAGATDETWVEVSVNGVSATGTPRAETEMVQRGAVTPNPVQAQSARDAGQDETKQAAGVEAKAPPVYKRGEVMLQWRDLGLRVKIKDTSKERQILHGVFGEVVRGHGGRGAPHAPRCGHARVSGD